MTTPAPTTSPPQEGVRWVGELAPGLTGQDHPFKRLRTVLERHPALSSTQRLVLLTLVAFSDELGIAWPARGRLETLTRLKPRTLRYAMRALEKCHLLSILMPRQDRKFSYKSQRRTVVVPDQVCVYFVWPIVDRAVEHQVRPFAMRYLEAQQPPKPKAETTSEDP